MLSPVFKSSNQQLNWARLWKCPVLNILSYELDNLQPFPQVIWDSGYFDLFMLFKYEES